MFKDDLLEELAKTPLEMVPIKSIIDKYCGSSVEFAKGDPNPPNKRLKIIGVLRELQKRDFIQLQPEYGLAIDHQYNPNKGVSEFLFGTDIEAKLTALGEMAMNRKFDRQLTIEVAESTKRANKISFVFALISTLIIIGGIVIQILQYSQQKETIRIQEDQLDIEVKSLHKSLHDSLCLLSDFHHNQTEIKHENNEYLSTIDTISKTK